MSSSSISTALAIMQRISPSSQVPSTPADSLLQSRVLEHPSDGRQSFESIVLRRASAALAARPVASPSDGPVFAASQAARIRSLALQPASAAKASALYYRMVLYAGMHGIPVVLDDREAFNNLVAAFVDELCWKNNSAASIHTNISLIYAHVSRALGGAPWGPFDTTYWRDIKAGLLEQHGAPRQVPNATTADKLHKLWDGLAINMPLPWPSWATDTWELLLTSYHLTLRPNEFTGPTCDLRKGNISFEVDADGNRFVVLTLRISKTLLRKHQVGSNTERTVAREIDGPLDAVRILEARCKALPFDPDAPIFPSPLGKYPTNAEFNKDLRKLCKVAGIEPNFTARGARRGRRTDMGTKSTATPEQINLLGRWSSVRASSNYQESNNDLLKCLPRSL